MTTPTKPTDNHGRPVRGGSWDHTSATFVRAADRIDSTPTDRDGYFGFRCAQRGARVARV